MRSSIIRVDKKFHQMLSYINYMRQRKGLKKLTSRNITSRLAIRYMRSEALIDDEFIKI